MSSEGRLEADAVLQFDQSLVLQQQQRAAAIGGIVRDRDGGAARQRIEGLVLLRVDADREVHRQRHATRSCSRGRPSGCRDRAGSGTSSPPVSPAAKSCVRHHVVGELDDLQFKALLGRDRLHGLEDLCMRPGRAADADGLRLRERPGEVRRSDRRAARPKFLE